MNTLDKFLLTNKTCIITGGAGLLGQKHAEAVAEAKGIPILLDLDSRTPKLAKKISKDFHTETLGIQCDITDHETVSKVVAEILKKFNQIDILINNAARNPKVEDDNLSVNKFENFPLDIWNRDIAVSLTGAFICSQIFGAQMAKQKSGVILNISSDLGIIAPDQRIYQNPDLAQNQQPVKPVTYSVVKHGIIGLTKYLATYYAKNGIRVNALCPGGVYNNQPDNFVQKLSNLIPMGRMAKIDEYKAAVLFLISDASSYMTGANLTIDGGRTAW